ncbi:hypothetical protein BDZ97DRAFT_1906091 [Flammula alnicola]|nr:hypothetical protein BDZ97DRAFT_1906091 [Flammula alnicola]
MLPPTSRLPSIKSISTYPIESLENALQYLRLIYSPKVRGSLRRRAALKVSKARKDQAVVDDALRTDAFERAYAIKWLTTLIMTVQCGEAADSKDTTVPSKREAIVADAASLLATCAGTASAGMLTRHFVFNVPDSTSSPITIELTDVPLDNRDYGSVGAQTWGGACVMAEMVAEQPEAFGLPGFGVVQQTARPDTLRCLELGAGTGLVSLTVAKIMERLVSETKADIIVDIVATDYYSSVLRNLECNVQSNFCKSSSDERDSIQILSKHLDWSTFCNMETTEPAFKEPFNVVYGADIIYEAQHATWIKSCLAKLLRRPSSTKEDPIFHLIIPLRATHAVESSTIEQVFQVQNDSNGPSHSSSYTEDLELVIKHKEIIICDAESGKDGEEIEYAYYKIGWEKD